jgi:hypothetical protein
MGGKIVGVASIVALVNSFITWWYGVGSGFVSVSWNAFDAGFLAWGGTFIAIAGGVFVLLAEISDTKVNLGGLKTGQIGLLLAGLGTLFVLLRWLTETDFVRFGLFLGIIAAAAITYGAVMSVRASGVGLPTADDFKSLGGGGDDDAPPPPPPA